MRPLMATSALILGRADTSTHPAIQSIRLAPIRVNKTVRAERGARDRDATYRRRQSGSGSSKITMTRVPTSVGREK